MVAASGMKYADGKKADGNKYEIRNVPYSQSTMWHVSCVMQSFRRQRKYSAPAAAEICRKQKHGINSGEIDQRTAQESTDHTAKVCKSS